MNPHRNENPVLITSAAPSYQDQLAAPLPWMAVLIANDRPPRKVETPRRLLPSRPALTAGGDGEESR